MRKVLSESPTIAVIHEGTGPVANISRFEIGNGVGRISRERLARHPRTARLESLHIDIATFSLFGFTTARMSPHVGKPASKLDLPLGQTQSALNYPGKVLTRQLFQRGFIDVLTRPGPLDLTEYDQRFLSRYLNGESFASAYENLGVNDSTGRKRLAELRERTGWEDVQHIALAGLMNKQVKIFDYNSLPHDEPPTIPEPVPEQEVSAPIAELPVAPFPTLGEIRSHFMDEGGGV